MHTVEIPGVRIASEPDGEPITPLHTAASSRCDDEPSKLSRPALYGIGSTFVRLKKAPHTGSVCTPARVIARAEQVAVWYFDGAVLFSRDGC